MGRFCDEPHPTVGESCVRGRQEEAAQPTRECQLPCAPHLARIRAATTILGCCAPRMHPASGEHRFQRMPTEEKRIAAFDVLEFIDLEDWSRRFRDGLERSVLRIAAWRQRSHSTQSRHSRLVSLYAIVHRQ